MTKLQEIINKSDNCISKITEEVIAIEGMSSPKNKHLLNNICGQSLGYLEIGTYRGCTLLAAAYENYNSRIWAIDNFSQFNDSLQNRKILDENIKRFASNIDITFLEMDFREIPKCANFRKNTIDALFYDGDHREQYQFDGLACTYDILKEEFICIIDDWNYPEVPVGTFRAISELNLQILEEYVLHADYVMDLENWWNGVYVARLRKTL